MFYAQLNSLIAQEDRPVNPLSHSEVVKFLAHRGGAAILSPEMVGFVDVSAKAHSI